MTEKIKIIADDKIPFLKGVLDPFANIFYLPPSQITKEVVKDADALLIRTRTKCDAELLEQSSVKFIATATIGFDHIDTGYLKAKRIKWINAPGCNSSSVQQYFASALVTLAKQNHFKLKDKTIGIVGVGNVGRKVAKIAHILGMKVLLNDPPRERIEGKQDFVSLDYLIEQSNIISFHVPLNISGIDKTFHLADSLFFEKFSSAKILINTSRGEVVEKDSLNKAIKDEKVSGCALDVWENEPNIDLGILKVIDIATPHIAGYSAEGKANGTAACVNALNNFFDLGLEQDWFPKYLPAPKGSNTIEVECAGKSKQDIFFDCITSTYNILEDDWRLRNSTKDFEKQRAEYPVRREFNYYNVHLINTYDSIKSAISELGFKINNIRE